MKSKSIEVFLTYTDNYPTGAFYLSRYEVQQVLREIKNPDLSTFQVGNSVFAKEEIRGVRINGNIGIELPYDQSKINDPDFNLLDLMKFINK